MSTIDRSASSAPLADTSLEAATPADRDTLDAFRRWGYLQAQLDPLGRLNPQKHPELDALSGPVADAARKVYCGSIGAEFMHMADRVRRDWVRDRMESAPPEYNKRRVLDRLIRAETFEQTLQSRYLGSKRFSLEGITSLIPLIDQGGKSLARHGARQVVIAMSHRGRLNVMAHVVGIPLAKMLAGFEDVNPRSVLGSGDVKYHLGATGFHPFDEEHQVAIHLVSNPSHLEAVHPVALGRTRAKQIRLGDKECSQVVPIILHGDAAFAGQGILAEALNLSELEGFDVGGAIHIVVNNLIGFTTEPEELHSSRFASDVARRLQVPIFHVNGEDLDAVIRVARMAVDYRYDFGTDVVIDLIGYRRHGHSEVDDPTITQPLLYKRIAEHPPLWQTYAQAIGASEEETKEQVAQVRQEMEAAQEEAAQMSEKPQLHDLPSYWKPYFGGPYEDANEVETGLDPDEIKALTERLTTAPEGFNVHRKIVRLLEQRAEMGRGARPVDFGMAEALAFGSLVKQGVPVRLTGQDSVRATFSQRQSVLIDVEDERHYFPLKNIDPGQAPFEVYNSMLSEAAVMGFEYGYSRDYPESLVLWEAQFGDFVNGAQIILDQFIAAAEDKWSLLSGLVLLLPHGYEGQGPEHSSARIERFLQLAAEDNIQVSQPSTAAQYFHLLRRQALRRWRKPLVVFTPKSMLRHPAATSEFESFSRDHFLTVLPDQDVQGARKLLLCTGKIRHELRIEREKQGIDDTAIVSLEQLYPFPEKALIEELARHPGIEGITWVQEEPANMGALFFVLPLIKAAARRVPGFDREIPVRSVKRSPSASPATGSARAHKLEQETLLRLALSTLNH